MGNKIFQNLYASLFKVITDHRALSWLMSVSGRLARWSLYLQMYTFEVIHRAGRIHSNVDCLSRPVMMIKASGNDNDLSQLQPLVEEEDTSSKQLDPN